MTVSTTVSKAHFDGNGATVEFSFPYLIYAKSHIYIVLLDADGTENIQVLDTDYTIPDADVGDNDGITVTMTTPPATNEVLTIFRAMPGTQPDQFRTGQTTYLEANEKAHDKTIMTIQQLAEILSRASLLSDTSQVTPPTMEEIIAAMDVDAGAVNKTALVFEIDGGGAAIETGAITRYVRAPSAGTITKATLLADQGGAIVVDVWKTTYALFETGVHPVDADSITASAPPTITATGDKSVDSTLTGWTTTFAEGDIFGVSVDNNTDIENATLQLDFTKSA